MVSIAERSAFYSVFLCIILSAGLSHTAFVMSHFVVLASNLTVAIRFYAL